MGDLALNFSRKEFRCPHCGGLVGPTQALLSVLQRVRTLKGEPLRIVSGYRCAVFNRRVGGIADSEHLVGGAADVEGGYASVAEWRAAGALGIGIRHGHVIHVDVAMPPVGVFADG